jgi:hypothetical protein
LLTANRVPSEVRLGKGLERCILGRTAIAGDSQRDHDRLGEDLAEESVEVTLAIVSLSWSLGHAHHLFNPGTPRFG